MRNTCSIALVVALALTACGSVKPAGNDGGGGGGRGGGGGVGATGAAGAGGRGGAGGAAGAGGTAGAGGSAVRGRPPEGRRPGRRPGSAHLRERLLLPLRVKGEMRLLVAISVAALVGLGARAGAHACEIDPCYYTYAAPASGVVPANAPA